MMEKSCHSFASNSTTTTTTTTTPTNNVANTNSSSSLSTSATSSSFTTTTSSHIQSSLKSLNKASYKISKPLTKSSHPNPNRPSPLSSTINSGGTPPQQPQPPVYNIDKNDFRDVVQKLTGSPAHHHPRPAPPPPPAPTTATTSRLHRIRPPPLAHLPPRSPPLDPPPPAAADVWMRPSLSPLPPFPAVSAVAESPISAYMRRLRGGEGGQPPLAPSPSAAALLLPPPTSPLGFGCLPSPRTAFQMMISSGMVFPTSPGVPLPSPRWGDP